MRETSRRFPALVLGLVVVAAWLERPACAEGGRIAGDVEAAVRLFIDGDYEAALARFEQLSRTRPSAEIDYDRAWCLSRLGREAEALDAFDAYLASWPGDRPERTDRAREEAARLRAAILGRPASAPAPAPGPQPPAAEPVLGPWLDEAPAAAPRDGASGLPLLPLGEAAPAAPRDEASGLELLPLGEVRAEGGAAALEPPSPEAVRDAELAPRRSSPFGYLEVGVDGGAALRSFEVPINPSCDADSRDQAAFQSSAYGSMGFRGVFYPGAIATRRWPAGFGLELAGSFALSLRVLNRRRNEEVEARQSLVELGPVYRYVWGTADVGLALRGRFGWTRYDFFLGDVGNDIVPPVTYDMLHLGVSAYVPFGTRHVGLELGVSYLAVLNVGAEMIEAYNGSGELPTAHGYQLSAVASGQIVRGLRWLAGFELLGVVSAHSGKGHGWGSDVGDNPNTLCTSAECIDNPTTCVDLASPERTPIEGGIMTTGPASDVAWRVIFGVSYRFGWDPDRAAQR